MKRQRHLRQMIVLLVLALALLSCFFVACNKTTGDLNSSDGDLSSTSTSGETEVSETEFSIVRNGIANFTIIAPEFPTAGEDKALVTIRSEIAEMTGVSLPFSDDWIRKGDSHDPDTYEILIGKTNYEETRSVLNETSYGSYSITVVGKKIVLAAWSERAIEEGSVALLQILRLSQSGRDLVVPISSISATRVVDSTLDELPVVPDLIMDHIYDANGAIEAIYENATPDHFDAYISKLSQLGYKKYAQNERGNVKSAIFTDEKHHTFNVFYEGGYEELCITVEKYSRNTLPPKAGAYTKVCETKFLQVGVEHKYGGGDAPQNGMCYIWRLEDGRFVILDGGFNYSQGAENVYEALKELALDSSEIVIASWIVSHLHSDHAGTFDKFTDKYLQKAEIESVILNVPTDEQTALAEMNSTHWVRISTRLQNVNPHVRFYKAHPGQIYHFANLEIEILYTLEMYAPEDLTYYNTCSLVVDMKFGSFNMVMLGDCSEDAGEILCKNYGEGLEAEVVQVAHHGYVGGSTALYTNIDPIYVFWPAGSSQYKKCENKVRNNTDPGRNQYFFMEGTRIQGIYVARATVILLTMQEDVGFLDRSIYDTFTDFLNGEGDTMKLKS